MKRFILMLAAFGFFLSSCSIEAEYFGDKLAPTTSVDVYYSAHDVKRDYKVIGHLNYPNNGQEIVKKQLLIKAKSIGADAIVITGNTVANGKYTSDIVNADALKYQ